MHATKVHWKSCPISTAPLHFITLSVMLLQEIFCTLNLVTTWKKKKKESFKTDYKCLYWHKWEIWRNGRLYDREKTYWAGFTNEEAVKWNDIFQFIYSLSLASLLSDQNIEFFFWIFFLWCNISFLWLTLLLLSPSAIFYSFLNRKISSISHFCKPRDFWHFLY